MTTRSFFSGIVDDKNKNKPRVSENHHTQRDCQQREENQAEKCGKRDDKQGLHHLNTWIELM